MKCLGKKILLNKKLYKTLFDFEKQKLLKQQKKIFMLGKYSRLLAEGVEDKEIIDNYIKLLNDKDIILLKNEYENNPVSLEEVEEIKNKTKKLMETYKNESSLKKNLDKKKYSKNEFGEINDQEALKKERILNSKKNNFQNEKNNEEYIDITNSQQYFSELFEKKLNKKINDKKLSKEEKKKVIAKEKEKEKFEDEKEFKSQLQRLGIKKNPLQKEKKKKRWNKNEKTVFLI
jgi:hypothetical protein